MKDLIVSSGGIDSTVLQYLFASGGEDVVHFDYGQLMLRETADCISWHCRKLGQKFHLLPLGALEESYRDQPSHIYDYSPEALPLERAFGPDNRDLRTRQMGYMEGRGALILLQACIFASLHNLDRVLIAYQMEPEVWADHDKASPDGIDQCDTGPDMLETVSELVRKTFRRPVKIYAPFMYRRNSKDSIVELGIRLGVDFNRTYSCEVYPRCFQCFQCLEAKKALKSQSVFPIWLTSA